MKAMRQRLDTILKERNATWTEEDKSMAVQIAMNLVSYYAKKSSGIAWADDEIRIAEAAARNIEAGTDMSGGPIVQELVMRTMKENTSGLTPG